MLLQIEAPPLPIFVNGGETTFEVGQTHPNRRGIGVFDLLIVTEGRLFLGEDREEFIVEEKNALILYPDKHHYTVKPCDRRTRFFWFHFNTPNHWSEQGYGYNRSSLKVNDPKNPFSEIPFKIIVPKFCKLLNWDTIYYLSKQLITYTFDYSSTLEWQKQMIFQQLLQELASTLREKKSLHTIKVAEEAAAYLRKNFKNRFSYNEIGKQLSYHPNYIARCMMTVFGCTIVEYVNRVRVDEAKHLLISTNMSIEKIAENCGFSQTAYFSRTFKKFAGKTPSAFRQQYFII